MAGVASGGYGYACGVVYVRRDCLVVCVQAGTGVLVLLLYEGSDVRTVAVKNGVLFLPHTKEYSGITEAATPYESDPLPPQSDCCLISDPLNPE